MRGWETPGDVPGDPPRVAAERGLVVQRVSGASESQEEGAYAAEEGRKEAHIATLDCCVAVGGSVAEGQVP